MVNLNSDFCSMVVDCIDKTAYARDESIFIESKLDSSCPSSRMINTAVLRNDQSNASLCPGLVVVDEGIRHAPLFIGIIRCHRRHYNAIGHGEGPYLPGLKKVSILSVHIRKTTFR
jgi:hypothetical protein